MRITDEMAQAVLDELIKREMVWGVMMSGVREAMQNALADVPEPGDRFAEVHALKTYGDEQYANGVSDGRTQVALELEEEMGRRHQPEAKAAADAWGRLRTKLVAEQASPTPCPMFTLPEVELCFVRIAELEAQLLEKLQQNIELEGRADAAEAQLAKVREFAGRDDLEHRMFGDELRALLK